MKLLIVDDEELTRTGVITSLDWASLGIDEVLQAAVKCIAKVEPDCKVVL